MNIWHIRNATLVIDYGEMSFLIDPFLGKKGEYPPFPNTPNQVKRNPTVDLPVAIEEIIRVDAVIVTHLHIDHFDEVAKKMLPKDTLIYTQNEQDAMVIRKIGFEKVTSLETPLQLGDITLTRTGGCHGSGEFLKVTGNVSGVVFQHPEEKTLYIAGDTIWCDEVRKAIRTYRPKVIVVNGGAAQFLTSDPITMDKRDIYETYLEAPDATIIVAHMEALNHCLLTREDLQLYVDKKGISTQVKIPYDGETFVL